MSKLDFSPEISDIDTPKIKIKKDGTRVYYYLGMLHRDPKEGPTLIREDGVGECYVRGILQDDRWYKDRRYENQEALDAVLSAKEEYKIGMTSGHRPVAAKVVYQGAGAVPVKKNKDPFGKMSERLKGQGFQDLQRMYAELSQSANAIVNERNNG